MPDQNHALIIADPPPTDLQAMLASARELLPSLRGLIDQLGLHRVTQATNAVVQQANRYIDSQARRPSQ